MHYFEAKKQFSFNLLDALYHVRRSWTIVSQTTMLNGFNKAFELTTPEMQDDAAETDLQMLFDPLNQLGLNSDGVKLNEFNDLDEGVCVTAELTGDDTVYSIISECPATTEVHPEENNDWEGIDDASTYPSPQEAVAASKLMRHYF